MRPLKGGGLLVTGLHYVSSEERFWRDFQILTFQLSGLQAPGGTTDFDPDSISS